MRVSRSRRSYVNRVTPLASLMPSNAAIRRRGAAITAAAIADDDTANEPVARQPNHRSLGDYLLARQLLNVQEHAAAVPLLERSLAPQAGERGLPSLEFVRAAHLSLVSALVEGERYADAARVLAALEQVPEQGNGHRAVHREWQRRIEFFASYPAP